MMWRALSARPYILASRTGPRTGGGAGPIGKAAARLAEGLSSVLTPCGGGGYFTGGGAEWRGRQAWENTLGPFNGGRAVHSSPHCLLTNVPVYPYTLAAFSSLD